MNTLNTAGKMLSESRGPAAVSVARYIREAIARDPGFFTDKILDGSAYVKVVGIDETGKDLAPALEKVLNEPLSVETSENPQVVYICGVAGGGSYLRKLLRADRNKGVVSAAFALFSTDKQTRGKPWVLVQDDDTNASSDERRELIKNRIGEIMAKIMKSADERKGCEGCCTGIFTSGTNSTYMTFCPAQPLGEVMSSAAKLLEAVGDASITITPVIGEIPEGTVVHSSTTE